MRKYRVHTPSWTTEEFTDIKQAHIKYEMTKDREMGDGVHENSFVELVYSDDDFEEYHAMVIARAVVDEERMKESTPQEDGQDYDYYAKWQETIYQNEEWKAESILMEIKLAE